ncbi:BamA/TamA family outer membrane protein [Taibaiella koreensis]|uniref:BamA/TamA family outer membrane protein n=1 Tax=Taibaiella koreensis TaxID=1268548 RepID=UPI0013C3393A|nr:BamA/TamA family outer membrane protein [Taibaiella koreensis]
MKRYLLPLVLAACLCLPSFRASAQQMSLVLEAVDTPVSYLDKKPLPARQTFDNPPEAFAYLRDLVPRIREQGYLAASTDSVIYADTTITVRLYRGPRYRWARLSFDKIPAALLTGMGIAARDWEGQPVGPRRLTALSERMLKYCEDNGYPFAYTTFSDIEGKPDELKASMVLERGELVRYDTLVIEGEVEVSREFLQQYLGIRQGDLYNESQLRLLSKRLSELPFLQEAQPWRIDFSVMGTKLHLYLKEKKANQLNGIIGLQPNTVETGKFLLTADILLALKNVLGYGESIAATYQNLQYKSPRFHADAALPYLLGTPFGLEGSFDLFKRDTTFRRTSFDAGVRYQFNATDYVKVGYQTFSNRLITADTNYVRNNRKLPDNLDVTTKGATVEFYMDRTDYRLNPRKGWQAKVSASGLVRSVLTNDAITGISDGSGFDYATLYDTANTDKYQYRISGSGNYYFPLARNISLRLGYNAGYISGKRLFLNELYQLGGFKLLRGFDEQSIYASQYHVGTLELRLLLGRNSCFYLFSDNAYIQAIYTDIRHDDYPVSFGGGITLENKSGIFNVAIGLGKHSGENFQFRQAKLHFGYTAYF